MLKKDGHYAYTFIRDVCIKVSVHTSRSKKKVKVEGSMNILFDYIGCILD